MNTNNLVDRINNRISLLAVVIGLIISIIILFIGGLSYRIIVISSDFTAISFYVAIILLAMTFLDLLLRVY